MTLNNATKDWLANNAGSTNKCYVTSGITYRDPDNIQRTGGTTDVISSYYLAGQLGSTVAIIANTTYSQLKTINGGVDIGLPDVSWVYANDGHTGTTAYCYVATTGDVNLSSSPGGAAIYIDNVLQIGIVTPRTITGLSPGSHSYKLTLSGYNDATGNFTITAGVLTTVPTVTMTPVVTTGSISGNVKDTSNVNISGATVSGAGTVTTDTNGNYTFANVSVGTYTVTASKTGYISSSISNVTVVAGQTTSGVNFSLSPVAAGTGSISGNVKDSSNANLSGATVSDGTRSTTTDTNGNYTISSVPAGTYTVTASKTGYVSSSQSVTLTSGENKTGINFSLSVTSTQTLASVSPSTWTIVPGDSKQFHALDTNGNEITSGVSWSVSGSGTISTSGLYTAPTGILSTQYATIYATYNSITKSAQVTIQPPGTLQSISLIPANYTVAPGSSYSLTAVCKNPTGNTIVCPTLVWRSDPTGIVLIDGTGSTVDVRGIAEGSSTIYASDSVSGTIGSTTVTVAKIAPSGGGGAGIILAVVVVAGIAWMVTRKSK